MRIFGHHLKFDNQEATTLFKRTKEENIFDHCEEGHDLIKPFPILKYLIS